MKTSSKRSQMSLHSYFMLYDSILDFKRTSLILEQELGKLSVRHDSQKSVPGMGARRHHDVWVSLKSVSHFNLGVALELMLKMLLALNGVRFPHTHSLVCLHDSIPEKYQNKLQLVYQECDKRYEPGFELVAFANAASDPPPAPKNLNLATLRDVLRYFDDDVMLHLKRYAWEQTAEGHWRHYISDISVFVMMIDDVMREIPREDIAKGSNAG